MALKEEDILARLTAIEDGTVERKTISDWRDWSKAAVAFSNSLSDGQPGVLFVSVYDNGQIEEKTSNFEKLARNVSGELTNIYPPIYPTILVMEKDGKKFMAVIIYGSADRPHFAGKSYIRDGTQTREASEENIQEFIAQRNSKAAEILKWKNKEITVNVIQPERVRSVSERIAESSEGAILDCNQHWVTLQRSGGRVFTVSLRQIELSYDTEKKRLILEIYP